MPFDLVDDPGVAEGAAVVLEVDGLGLRAEQVEFAARVVVALFEGLEGGGRLAFEAEGGGDFGPVEFQGGGALGWVSVGSDASLDRVGWVLGTTPTPAAMSAFPMAMDVVGAR